MITQEVVTTITAPLPNYFRDYPIEYYDFIGMFSTFVFLANSSTPLNTPLLMFHRVKRNGTINAARFWIQSISGGPPSNCITARFWKLNNAYEKIVQVGASGVFSATAATTVVVQSSGTPIPVSIGEILGLELTVSVVPTGSTNFQIYRTACGARVPGSGVRTKSGSYEATIASAHSLTLHDYPSVVFSYTDGDILGPYYLNGSGGQSQPIMYNTTTNTRWTGFRFYTDTRLRIMSVTAPIQRAGATSAVSGGQITADVYWAPGSPLNTAVTGTIPASTLIYKGTSDIRISPSIAVNNSMHQEFSLLNGVTVDPGWVYVAFRQAITGASATGFVAGTSTEGHRLAGGASNWQVGLTWPQIRYGQFNKHFQFFDSLTGLVFTPTMRDLGIALMNTGDGVRGFGYSYLVEPTVSYSYP